MKSIVGLQTLMWLEAVLYGHLSSISRSVDEGYTSCSTVLATKLPNLKGQGMGIQNECLTSQFDMDSAIRLRS